MSDYTQTMVDQAFHQLVSNGVAPLDDGSYTLVTSVPNGFGEPANTEYRIGVAKKMVSRGVAKRVDLVRFLTPSSSIE